MELGTIGITGTTALLLTGCVIGAVELVKALFKKDWQSAAIIATAAVVGGLVSPLIGIEIITGIVGGLAASGAVTLAQNLSY